MKLKRLLTLCCALSMALGMVTFASAADYSFKTSPDPVYYGSTNYERLYDAEYRYGSRNQIDYDIPEIQYGLSQEFLESSLNNPYLNGNTQYGFGGSSSNTQYPESDFGSSSFISGGGTIEMPYARYGEIGVGLARGTDSNGLACWYCVQVFLVDGCEVTWVDVPAIG